MKKIKYVVLCLILLTAGCELKDKPDSDTHENALLDVNPTSPTFNSYVLPDDYKGMVSAWYFGHST